MWRQQISNKDAFFKFEKDKQIPCQKREKISLKLDGEEISLTPREMECLSLIIKNKTVKQVAKELSLSPRTIETYLDNVKTKMNQPTLVDLIKKSTEFEPLRYFIWHYTNVQ